MKKYIGIIACFTAVSLKAFQVANYLNKPITITMYFTEDPKLSRGRKTFGRSETTIAAHDVGRVRVSQAQVTDTYDNTGKTYSRRGIFKMLHGEFPAKIIIKDSQGTTLIDTKIEGLPYPNTNVRTIENLVTYFTLKGSDKEVALQGPLTLKPRDISVTLQNRSGKAVEIAYSAPVLEMTHFENSDRFTDLGNSFDIDLKVLEPLQRVGEKSKTIKDNEEAKLFEALKIPENLPIEITYKYADAKSSHTYTIRLKDLIYHGVNAYSNLIIIDKDGQPVMRREESKEQKVQQESQESKENKGEAEQTTTTSSSSQQQQAQVTVTSASS